MVTVTLILTNILMTLQMISEGYFKEELSRRSCAVEV